MEAIPLQNHHLGSNSTFVFKVKENESRNKYIELVLEKLLDLEKQSPHHLLLTALDGEDHLETMQYNTSTPYVGLNVHGASLGEAMPWPLHGEGEGH